MSPTQKANPQKPTRRKYPAAKPAESRLLTPEQVQAIREAYAQSTATTCASLARRYKVTPALVHGIVAGHYYRDCGGPITTTRPVRRRADHVGCTDEVEVTVTRSPVVAPPPRRVLGPGYVVRLQDAALSVGQTGPLMAVDSHEDEHGRVRVTWLAQGHPRFARIHESNLQIVGGRLLGGSGR